MEAAVPLERVVDAWRDLAQSRGGAGVPMFAKKPDPHEMRERSDLRRRWFGTSTMAIALVCVTCVCASMLYTLVRLNRDLDTISAQLEPHSSGIVNASVSMLYDVSSMTSTSNSMLEDNVPYMNNMMNNTDAIINRFEELLRHPTITLSLEPPTPTPTPTPSWHHPR
tara:strand:- start:292 stop:792 length:501 start_codon:yes stop_codon:yes gene_type:complete